MQDPTAFFGVSDVPTEHERGPSLDIPMAHPTDDEFHASYHIQNVQPYACLSCIVCGKSVEEIKQRKINWYIKRSTPRNEPAYVTSMRQLAYSNGLTAGRVLFLAPVVSQAAACDGTTITTTSFGQEIAKGTLTLLLN